MVFLCCLGHGLRGGLGAVTADVSHLRRPAANAQEEGYMMMNGCGPGMMLIGGVGILLGLTLLASLIVLVWAVIGRLRREPTVPPSGRS